MDCSSPMSAKISLKTLISEPELSRDVQAGLAHQRKKPDRLQRDRLSAGIGSGDHQDERFIIQYQVDRYD